METTGPNFRGQIQQWTLGLQKMLHGRVLYIPIHYSKIYQFNIRRLLSFEVAVIEAFCYRIVLRDRSNHISLETKIRISSNLWEVLQHPNNILLDKISMPM